jgi:RNA polymerase sigma-70 factor (ECF subfamily)
MQQDVVKAATLLQSQNPASIDEALRLLQATVFNFSMKLCGHRKDAEDTMQNVLLKTVTNPPSVREYGGERKTRCPYIRVPMTTSVIKGR